VARCYAAAARCRADFLHQASARLVRDYDLIVLEKLNIKGLARGFLAKDVQDASWGKFVSMLRYKAECAGSRIIEVDASHTTRECSGCGAIVFKGLAERVHRCMECGLMMDRDLNAAVNILNRAGVGPGLHNVAGYGMRAGGNLDAIVGAMFEPAPN
jgi:putative transposase